MEEIVKHINDTNASYRHPSAGDAKNTDLFLDNEHYEMFKDCGEQITVRYHKDNLTQAILFIASLLPRKFDQSATHEVIKFSKEFVFDQLALLDSLFKDGNESVDTFTQIWNARKDVPQKNGKIDKRFYFNGLLKDVTFTDSHGKVRTTKFTIRNYFAGGYSELHIRKAEGNIFDIYIENKSEYYNDGKEDGYEEEYVNPNFTPSPETVRKSFIRFWTIVDQHGADYEYYVSQFEEAINTYVSEVAGVENVFSILDIRQYQKVIGQIVNNHAEMAYLQKEQGPDGKKYYVYSTNKHYIEYLQILAATNNVKVTAEDINLLSTTINKLDNSPLQQIYYGAPGTGKSHSIKEQTQGEDVVRTTFHPDSDYATFVGAYKPTTAMLPICNEMGEPMKIGGTVLHKEQIVYEFVSQAFLQAYVEAWKKQGEATPKKEYLVIEEINRGNCAQIFGDLFQLLDRNEYGFSEYPIKADADMKKQLKKALNDVKVANRDDINAVFKDEKDIVSQVLSGDILLLPDNLYIWATMNTSDQSLFPIDSAFKRRWDWQYVPISDAGAHWVIKTNGKRYSWWGFLKEINKRIYDATYSEDKKLGYFFCKAKDGVIDAKTFVGKVVFYLWNDVFKDTEFEGDAFKDVDGTKLSFDKFYTVEDGKTKVVDEKIDTLLTNLGLVAMVDDEDIDVYVGQEESPSNAADQSTWTASQRTNYNYWSEFLTYAQGNDEFQKYFGGVKSPNKDNWKSFAIGEKTFYLSTLLQQRQKGVMVQVYIPEDHATYNNLLANKEAIEAEMGTTYNWNEFPQYKCFTIEETMSGVDLSNQESRIKSFEFLIDRLLRMREVFPKYK